MRNNHHHSPSSSLLPSSVRIYATAYRSITLPGDADFCWAAMSPLTSIGSWGCTIVDKCEVDPTNEKIRLVYLVPANPSQVVMIREKCIKSERSPGGEKGTIVYENLIMDDESSSSSAYAAASPFPAKIIEMTTSLTISRVTTLSSPLGRSFVELRSSFVVETPEDATAVRMFLETNIFDPLLHSAAEMLIPCHPFRDAMFHSVMRHFETSVENLIDAGQRLKALERVSRGGSAAKNGANTNKNSSSSPSSSPDNQTQQQQTTADPNEIGPSISITEYTASSVSISQELYSAWLETSRELRRIENKYDDLIGQMEELKDSTLLRKPEDEHHMSARYDGTKSNRAQQHSSSNGYSSKHSQVVAASRKPFDKINDHGTSSVTSPSSRLNNHGIDHNRNLRMQDAIALNMNNTFGHDFNQEIKNKKAKSNGNYNRHEKIASVVLPPPEGWEQEIFDDAEDDLVDQDGGVGDHDDHRFMAPRKYDNLGDANNQNDDHDLDINAPPPPPPRRVLGNK